MGDHRTGMMRAAVRVAQSAVLRSAVQAHSARMWRAPCVRTMSSTPIAGFETTYSVLKPGDSSRGKVTRGSTVTVHATGVVAESGKQFWSTKDPGQQPFTYEAGVGQVITGWDEGLMGMTVGEERLLTIPADEGYGADGFPAWGNPAGGTLEFTLEVLSVE